MLPVREGNRCALSGERDVRFLRSRHVPGGGGHNRMQAVHAGLLLQGGRVCSAALPGWAPQRQRGAVCVERVHAYGGGVVFCRGVARRDCLQPWVVHGERRGSDVHQLHSGHISELDSADYLLDLRQRVVLPAWSVSPSVLHGRQVQHKHIAGG